MVTRVSRIHSEIAEQQQHHQRCWSRSRSITDRTAVPAVDIDAVVLIEQHALAEQTTAGLLFSIRARHDRLSDCCPVGCPAVDSGRDNLAPSGGSRKP